MSCIDALERTLAAFGESLTGESDALVELCRSTARAVDESPGRAALVKEYRECLLALFAIGRDSDTDAFSVLMAELARTPVGDTT